MSSKLLQMCVALLGRRHLVNAYEVNAGVGSFHSCVWQAWFLVNRCHSWGIVAALVTLDRLYLFHFICISSRTAMRLVDGRKRSRFHDGSFYNHFLSVYVLSVVFHWTPTAGVSNSTSTSHYIYDALIITKQTAAVLTVTFTETFELRPLLQCESKNSTLDCWP